ncbi:MAG: hypothetical protein R2834_03780 [Rhodothermales bacterium]
MKKTILLLAIATLAIAGWTYLDHPADMDTPETAAVKKVMAIRYMTLKEGVSSEDFERYWLEEFLPVADQYYHVGSVMLMKGDRGKNTGGYVWYQEFKSEQARTWYYNSENPGSWQQVFEACAECQETMQRLSDFFLEDPYQDYTDYVEVK